MPYPVLLILYYGIQIDILHALENIELYIRIGLLKLRDQLLGLQAFA